MGELPLGFKKLKLKRDYYSCVLVDFNFRAIPKQGVFVGKSEITFRAYALNEDELKKLDEEIDKSDIGDALSLIEGSTTESLEQIQADIDTFLNEPDEEEKKSGDQSNPFKALIGGYNKKEKKSEEKEKKEKEKIGDKPIKQDSWKEKNHFRKLMAEEAKENGN